MLKCISTTLSILPVVLRAPKNALDINGEVPLRSRWSGVVGPLRCSKVSILLLVSVGWAREGGIVPKGIQVRLDKRPMSLRAANCQDLQTEVAVHTASHCVSKSSRTISTMISGGKILGESVCTLIYRQGGGVVWKVGNSKRGKLGYTSGAGEASLKAPELAFERRIICYCLQRTTSSQWLECSGLCIIISCLGVLTTSKDERVTPRSFDMRWSALSVLPIDAT